MSESEIVSVARWEELRREPSGDAPRFSVRHLLMLITLSAMHMAVLRNLAGGQPGISAVWVFVWQSQLIGMAYMGGLEVVIRACRRAQWRIEPGHWLLAAIGGAAAVQILAEVANHFLAQKLFAAAGIYLSVLGLLLLPLLLVRDTPRVWKVFVGIQLALLWQRVLIAADWLATGWILSTLNVVTAYEPLATLFLILFVAWMDPQRNRRGWLHWSGGAAWILSRSAPALASWI